MKSPTAAPAGPSESIGEIEPGDLLDPAVLRGRLLALRARTPDVFDASWVPDGFKHSAVLIPLWEDAGRIRTVLGLRPQTMSSHRGQIAFPGGRVDPTDPSLLHTALREAHEEVGIGDDLVELTVPLDHTWSIQRYLVAPWAAWLHSVPALVPSPNEIERMIVADLAALIDPAAHSSERVERDGLCVTMHEYRIGNDRVWGLTAGIIYSLIRTLCGRPVDADSRGPETLRRFARYF